MTDKELDLLKLKIQEIFKGEVNETVVYLMVVNFIDNLDKISNMDTDSKTYYLKPIKDFLLGLRFAEHPGIRNEAQKLLGSHFS